MNWLNLHAGVVHIGIGGVETTAWGSPVKTHHSDKNCVQNYNNVQSEDTMIKTTMMIMIRNMTMIKMRRMMGEWAPLPKPSAGS